MVHRGITILLAVASCAACGAATGAPSYGSAVLSPAARPFAGYSAGPSSGVTGAAGIASGNRQPSDNVGDLLVDRLMGDDDPRAAARPSTKVRPILHRHELGVRLVIRF